MDAGAARRRSRVAVSEPDPGQAPAPAEPDARSLVVDRTAEGVRLDVLLTRHLARLRTATRTRVQRWIAAGHVRINGRVTRRAARPLHAGDEVLIELPWRRTVADHQPEQIPLDILYEDDHLLIVSKPAGMLVHPTGRHRTGTLFHALLWRAQDWDSEARPGLVHRLDRGTSGVIMVAKSRPVHARAARMLRGPHARKRYLAIVAGDPPDEGVIRVPLTRLSDSPPRMGAASEGGLPCETRYRVLSRGRDGGAGLALVECTLVTGRLHQIRAHLHAAGWPIVGDPVYGPAPLDARLSGEVREVAQSLGRQALHAWRLSLPHAVTGVPIDVAAPVPPDLVALLTAASCDVPDAGAAGTGAPAP